MRMIDIRREAPVRKLAISDDNIEDLIEIFEEQLSLSNDDTWTSGFEGEVMFNLRIINEEYYVNPENRYYSGNKRIEKLLHDDM